MILIADSGGSKTDWALICERNVIFEVSTVGMHPSVIAKNVSSLNVFDKYTDSIEKIFFYGTGCYYLEQQKIVKQVLKIKFYNAEISVLSDLMVGVHIGLSNNIGYVGIIGTGSAMAYFDSNNLQLITDSKGHIEGDPGSAICLMRTCENNFNECKSLATELINDKMRRCLSFLRKKIDVEGDSTIVEQEFRKYFEYYKINTDRNKVDIVFIGGVANLFKDVLIVVAEKFRFNVVQIINKPIMELNKYYSNLSSFT